MKWLRLRRLICWVRGHQYTRTNRTTTIHASFCLRCFHTPKRPAQRIWWSA